MRAVVQRVRTASVTVGDSVVAEIGAGVVVLLGVASGDTSSDSDRLARKVARLRIFENVEGRFDRSLVDASGEALVVSQFTLIADTSRGNRPSFAGAADPDVAASTYDRFCAALEENGVPTSRGVFGARMEVALVNDGPVTIVIDL